MKTLDFGISSDYSIRISSSPVFECALGIAAFTREEIHDKLDTTLDDLRVIRDGMSDELRREVHLSGDVHTWRSLLLLAHRCPYLMEAPWDQHMDAFLHWIQENVSSLVQLAAPYLGEQHVSMLNEALVGNVKAQQELLQFHSENPVVYLNLRYLFSVDPNTLLQHLKTLVERWYHEVLCRDSSQTMLALQQDVDHTKRMAQGVHSSELIRTVTRGSELKPLPGADTLWLIPQYAYRPFTILNFLPHCAVYYYPAADALLPGSRAQTQMAQVAGIHKALGDVQRIRLLDLIRLAPKSLGELTDRLNATKSNVHHHLALLRTAGLVQVDNGVYSLNHDAISRVGDELRTFLGLKESDGCQGGEHAANAPMEKP